MKFPAALILAALTFSAAAQTTPTGPGRKFTLSTIEGGHVLKWNADAGYWTNEPPSGSGDAGGTNARQIGSLVLSNLAGNPYHDYTNVSGLWQPLSAVLTEWALYPTNVWNSRQGGSATLTNLAANPIPFTNILVQGSGVTLTTNSGVVTVAATGGGSSETIARATANIVNTNTAFVDATNLTFAVAASTSYRFRFVVHYTSAATTTGARFAIDGPASPTALRVGGILPTGTGAMNSGSQTAYNTAIFAATTGPGATAVTGVIEGVFRNGSNAGNLTLRVASEIGLSAVTILADSYGEIQSF